MANSRDQMTILKEIIDACPTYRNMSSVCRTVGINYGTMSDYVGILEPAGLVEVKEENYRRSKSSKTLKMVRRTGKGVEYLKLYDRLCGMIE